MVFKFDTSVLGGSFDHFHKGHKEFLKRASLSSRKIIIGITSDEFVRNLKSKTKNPELFEDFKTRKKSVEGYLNKNSKVKFEILRIDDMFGPTLNKDFKASAIFITEKTKEGAKEINRKRLDGELDTLEIIQTEEVLAEDGKSISSSRIRQGEIDRNGKLFVNPKWLLEDREITDELREELKRPLGELVQGFGLSMFNFPVIAVGDETSKVLNSLGIKSQISIVDFKVAREKKFTNIKELGFTGKEKKHVVSNPPGTITSQLFNLVKRVRPDFNNRQVILIEGEEDLSVLPFVLSSALGTTVFYGQPKEGLVKVVVNEKTKAKIREIVARFKTLGH